MKKGSENPSQPIEQVRTTLQLINKMLRKEAKPQELAALLKIKEVREILELHKVNPKESSERITQYQKELAAKLRAHDRGQKTPRLGEDTAPSSSAVSTEESSGKPPPLKKMREDKQQLDQSASGSSTQAGTTVVSGPTARERRAQALTGILSQSELALPPSSSAPLEFSVEWIQHFFQLMCSRVPFFSDKKLLSSGPTRTYVEESEDQRVFIDGLSSSEIILLLNFVYDLESNLIGDKEKSSGSAIPINSTGQSASSASSRKPRTIIVPNKFVFIPLMGDPLESGLLDSWYYSNPTQCATCGLRYNSRKQLTAHHDFHYQKCTAGQRRKKGLENNFRSWMETASEWLSGGDADASVDFVPGVFFKTLNEGMTSAFFSIHQATGQDHPMGSTTGEEKQTPAPALVSTSSSHNAAPLTEMQHISDELLPRSIPVDEIKSRCFECGERFEKMWIPQPIDMAVYIDAVALPVGGGGPLKFNWTNIKQKNNAVDVDDDAETADSTILPTSRIDAEKALFDQRFVDSIFVHAQCLDLNPRIKSRDYQMSELLNTVSCLAARELEIPTLLEETGHAVTTPHQHTMNSPPRMIEESVDDDEEMNSGGSA